MNIPQILMTKDAARDAFRQYQAAVRADRPNVRKVWRDEDVGLMQAYKQLARGHAVIDLAAVMRAAGTKTFDSCPLPLPLLAIVPSDAARCAVLMRSDGGATFADARDFDGWRDVARRPTYATSLPAGTYPTFDGSLHRYRKQSTLVPLIPPALRPKFKLGNYRTLFEVESWTVEPPRDPLLLKKLGGGLYAVLASWDLTDVERAILRGR